jgi:hypothetical protein
MISGSKRGQALNVDKSIPNEVIEIKQENVPVQGLTPFSPLTKLIMDVPGICRFSAQNAPPLRPLSLRTR